MTNKRQATPLASPAARRHTPSMRDRQPCVYILASGRNGTIYTGVTSDLMARLHQHRHAARDGFTRRYGVTQLVRFEQCEDMTAAIAREKQLKRWHREWKVNLIEQDNPEWSDLAIGLGFPPPASHTPSS